MAGPGPEVGERDAQGGAGQSSRSWRCSLRGVSGDAACYDTGANPIGTLARQIRHGVLSVGGACDAGTVENALLERARTGDELAFGELVGPHRRELQVHCYRMLGSLTDAEDTLQETLLSAWRGLPGFEGRSSVRSWLYRIATNQCLNARRAARPHPGRAAATVSAARADQPRRDHLAPAVPGPAAGQRADTPRRGPRPGIQAGKRSSWRSSPDCSGCRRGRPPYWCSAMCSALPVPRRPLCWKPPRPPSRGRCNARGRRSGRVLARPAPAGRGNRARTGPAVRRRLPRRRHRRPDLAADRRRPAVHAARPPSTRARPRSASSCGPASASAVRAACTCGPPARTGS